MSTSLVTAWSEAAGRARGVALAVCGGVADVRPWAELSAELGPPPAWTLPALLERARVNALRYRANYACVLAAWCVVCAMRHPVSTICVALIAAASFHALLCWHASAELSPAILCAPLAIPRALAS